MPTHEFGGENEEDRDEESGPEIVRVFGSDVAGECRLPVRRRSGSLRWRFSRGSVFGAGTHSAGS